MNRASTAAPGGTLWYWAFIGLACVARFIHLDADPWMENWIGYITDEGRWIETARNLALFGSADLYGLAKLHLVLSPGFQGLTYLVFKVAGVDFVTARWLAAVSGSGVLVLAAWLLARHVRGVPLGVGAVVLATEPMLLGISRIAIPEMPSLFFSLLSFALVLGSRRRLLCAVLAGLAMAVAVSMKATTVLILPGFVILVVMSGSADPPARRLLRGALFTLGVALPATLGLVAGLVNGAIHAEALLGIAHFVHVVQRFLALADSYTVVTRLLASPGLSMVQLLLLGAWLASWVLAFGGEFRRTPLGELYRLSGIWSAAWIVAWAFLDYTPARYLVHLIVPLTIHVVAGLGLWQSTGPARVLESIEASRRLPAFSARLWLVLPSGWIMSALLVRLLPMLGVAEERLLYRLVVLAVVVTATMFAARRAHRRHGVALAFIAFPLLAALLGMVFDHSRAVFSTLSTRHLLLGQVLLAAGAAAYSLNGWRTGRWFLQRGLVPRAAAAVLLIGLLCGSAPMLLQPTYSIREASRAAGALLNGSGLVRSRSAGSLMIENGIRYRDEAPEGSEFDGVLNFSARYEPGPEWQRVHTLRLVIHRRFDPSQVHVQAEPGFAWVDVYRRSLPSADASDQAKVSSPTVR